MVLDLEITKQLAILLGAYFAGEIFNKVLRVPLPGVVLGMMLLFILLCANVVKVKQIERVGETLLSYIQLFFIPPGVAIIAYFDVIAGEVFKVAAVIILSGAVTFAATAWTVQSLAALQEKRGSGRES